MSISYNSVVRQLRQTRRSFSSEHRTNNPCIATQKPLSLNQVVPEENSSICPLIYHLGLHSKGFPTSNCLVCIVTSTTVGCLNQGRIFICYHCFAQLFARN